MIRIENLHATVADKPILNGVSLHVPAGEVHAIMGPNGSGKSTLAYVLAGRPGYEVTEGAVTFTSSSCSGEGRSVGLNSQLGFVALHPGLRPSPEHDCQTLRCSGDGRSVGLRRISRRRDRANLDYALRSSGASTGASTSSCDARRHAPPADHHNIRTRRAVRNPSPSNVLPRLRCGAAIHAAEGCSSLPGRSARGDGWPSGRRILVSLRSIQGSGLRRSTIVKSFGAPAEAGALA